MLDSPHPCQHDTLLFHFLEQKHQGSRGVIHFFLPLCSHPPMRYLWLWPVGLFLSQLEVAKRLRAVYSNLVTFASALGGSGFLVITILSQGCLPPPSGCGGWASSPLAG